jgi:hypothetical protein
MGISLHLILDDIYLTFIDNLDDMSVSSISGESGTFWFPKKHFHSLMHGCPLPQYCIPAHIEVELLPS